MADRSAAGSGALPGFGLRRAGSGLCGGADGAAGAKDILLSKDDANTFLKRVISRSNSVMSESLRSDSESNVDTETPIEILGKFNKMYENKKVLDFFDDNSYVFSLNNNCHISYNTDTDDEDNHIININKFCFPHGL